MREGSGQTGEHSEDQDLPRLLAAEREGLLGFVRKRGGSLLSIEPPEDLVQGICAHVLSRPGTFEPRTGSAFSSWLLKVAENYLHDRRAHWGALKRSGGRVLRMSLGDSTADGFEPLRELAASVTGPSTFAVRREQLTFAALALEMLLPADRELVERSCQGHTVAEEAERTGRTPGATERARLRALERFRRAFRIAIQGRAG